MTRFLALALAGAVPAAAATDATAAITTTTTRGVAASDLSHDDVVWLARHDWGVHENVLEAMEDLGAFTLGDLDCSFLDALKQEPFRFMAFQKFCEKAAAATTQQYDRTVAADGSVTAIRVAEAADDTAPGHGSRGRDRGRGRDRHRGRRLASITNGASGIHIARDNSSLMMGVDADVRLYRGVGEDDDSTVFLGVDAVEMLVEQDLSVGGVLTVDGVAVEPAATAAALTELNEMLEAVVGFSASPEVVKVLPDDCVGRVWLENRGLYECVRDSWVQTYDGACDDNPHTPESHVLYNGGGELGVGSDGYATGWEEYCCGDFDATDASQAEVTTDWAKCGRHSFHWKSTKEGGSNWDLVEQTRAFRFEMLAGCTYAASFWAYCTNMNREFKHPGHFRTEFLRYGDGDSSRETLDTSDDSDNDFRDYHLVATTDEGKWTYFEHPGVSPANNSYGVSLNFGMVDGWSGECFVDHVQIYSTDCAVEPNYICGTAEESVDHPDQGNLIFNGGFEILEDHHVVVAEGDYAAGFGRFASHGSTGLLSDDMAHCGSYSLKFTSDSSSTSWDLVENVDAYPIDLVKDCTYNLEFCAINTDGSGDLRTEFLTRSAAGTQTGVTTTDDSDAVYIVYHGFNGEDVWECFTHNFTVDANQSSFLNIGMATGWTGTFFLDDLHLYSTNCEVAPAWRNCSDAAGNIFPDGHFEDDTSGTFPAAFSTYHSPSGTTITVSDEKAFCGQKSLKYSSAVVLDWDLLMNDECIEMDAGDTYLVSFQWLAASPSEGATDSLLPQAARSELLYYTNSADMVYDGLLATTSTSESTYVKTHEISDGYVWQYFEHRVTADADYGCVKMNFGMQDGWQGTYYFDQIQIVCETC